MKSNFSDRRANIKDKATRQVVETIDRRFKAREMLSGQQTYQVTCARGIDMALVCAMCICWSERKNENKKGMFHL